MSDVTLYWRPMCGYCEILKRDLARRDVVFDEVDIWSDRAQATVVREVTGGDEIVPTVRVGERFLVNPSVDEIVGALSDAA